MESKYITFSLFIIYLTFLITSSNSKSIIKNLPGFHGDLPFTLETGYVGVGENDEIQAFYYFVESERDPSHDPLLLYLTGGPGTTGLFPFLYQIGPLRFNSEISFRDNITLELNPNSWSKEANMIFVDLPAGAGFAYATTWEGSRSSDSLLALHSYDFLKKWLMDHPTFLKNPLYISGISYMGILIPIVTLEAYKGNERGDQPQLNIKGCILISPLTDRFIDFNSRLEFAHRVALISDDIYESAKQTCNGNYVYNDPENALCSNNLQRFDECTSRINLSNILDSFCDVQDPEPECIEATFVFIETWASKKEVQKALNVREGTIETWSLYNGTMHYDFKKEDNVCYSYDIFSTISNHKQLLTRNCQVLIISGDHDMTFPYVGVEQWITSLNLTVKSPWNPWFVRTQVAGYQMKYEDDEYSLTYATVKGAGHSVALYKPEQAKFMVVEWLHSQAYLSDH